MDIIYNWWNGIMEEWGTSWQGTGFFVLFAISLIHIFLKKKEKVDILLIFSVCILFLYFNPLIYGLVVDIIGLGTIYPRMLLCLPSSVLIAYMFADCIHDKEKECNKRLLLGVLLVVLIGNCVYATDKIKSSENWYHIPSEAIHIVEILETDSGNLEEVVVAMPYYPACRFVYLVDTSFHMPYGRRGWGSTGEESKELYLCLTGGIEDYDILLKDAYICNCNYLVVHKERSLEEFLKRGCRFVGETDHYLIYCMKNYEAVSVEIEERRQDYIEKWGGSDWRN